MQLEEHTVECKPPPVGANKTYFSLLAPDFHSDP